jgi:protein adenylyltransferase
MRAKFGLTRTEGADRELVMDLLVIMAEDGVDYTIFFRRLGDFRRETGENNAPLRDLFVNREAFDAWAGRYRARLALENSSDAERRQRMNRINPKYVLRNYLAQVAIRKATDEKDYSEIERLLQLLRRPYDDQPEMDCYAGFPPEWAQQIHVSCSS